MKGSRYRQLLVVAGMVPVPFRKIADEWFTSDVLTDTADNSQHRAANRERRVVC
jgi:hypothetical protein